MKSISISDSNLREFAMFYQSKVAVTSEEKIVSFSVRKGDFLVEKCSSFALRLRTQTNARQ